MTTSVFSPDRRAGLLQDHRGFERASIWFIAAAALVLTGVLVLTQHGDAAVGLIVGAALAVLDARMLGRSLTRFAARSGELKAQHLTTMMLARFLFVAVAAGLLVSMGRVSPLGVVAGLLLFPVGVVTMALRALSAERRERPAGEADAAR
jgi:hypothetical protein